MNESEVRSLGDCQLRQLEIEVEKQLRLDPKDLQALSARGFLQAARNDPASIDTTRQVRNSIPTDTVAISNLVTLLAHFAYPRDALEAITQGWERSGHAPQLLEQLILMHVYNGLIHQARALLDQYSWADMQKRDRIDTFVKQHETLLAETPEADLTAIVDLVDLAGQLVRKKDRVPRMTGHYVHAGEEESWIELRINVSVDSAEPLVALSLELPRWLAKTDIGDRLVGTAIAVFERFPDPEMAADAA